MTPTSRTGAAVAIATLAMAFIQPASAGTTNCTYNPKTKQVTISVDPGHSQVSIHRDGDEIAVLTTDVIDCGDATRFNTDKIVLNDAPKHSVMAFISLYDHGPLRPGATNEPGNSDEIEIELNLGSGSDDFDVHGQLEVADFMTGGIPNPNNPDRLKVNLNANETAGVDADVTINGVLGVAIFEGFGGADHLSMGGGAGTGDPYPGETYLDGYQDNDILLGGRGADILSADEGDDVLKGKKGPDSLEGDAGKDDLDGGPAADECDGGTGRDTVKNCEL